MVKFCVNSGSQYLAVVIAASAGNVFDIGPKVLLEPVLGLGMSAQFITAAKTAAERRDRILTLLSFFSTSAAALTTDPATNLAVGGCGSIKYQPHASNTCSRW